MGKDADCCDACRLFGDQSQVPPRRDDPPAVRDRVKIVVRHRGQEREIVPTGKQMTVGRATQNDIVIEDAVLSRRQCVLHFRDDGVFVEDTKSTCGTYVDGELAHGRTRLRDGAQIHFGDSLLRIVTR